jgi:hypothetical protein
VCEAGWLTVLLIGSLVGGAWFMAFVVTHVGTFATFPIRNRSAAVLALFGGSVAGALLSAAFVPADAIPTVVPTSHRAMAVLAALLVMACCFVLYMPLYYTIATSLSVQTMIAIEEAPGQRLALGTLASPDVYGQIVAGRLASMVQSGYLSTDGDRYRATPRGRRMAHSFGALKDLWRLGPGG